MSNAIRQSAGTPVGGQFATTGRAPSDMHDLDLGTGPSTREIEARLAALYTEDPQDNEAITRLSLKASADAIRAQYPRATSVTVRSNYTDGAHAMYGAEICDSEGNVIGTVEDIEPADETGPVTWMTNLRPNDPEWTSMGIRADSESYHVPLRPCADINAAPYMDGAPVETLTSARDAFEIEVDEAEDLISTGIADRFPNAVSWSATTWETNDARGHAYSTIEVTLADGTKHFVDEFDSEASAAYKDVLGDLTDLEGPLKRDSVHTAEIRRMR